LKDLYLIIETGYEGIESLLYVTKSTKRAKEKLLYYKEKAIKDKIAMRKRFNKDWDKEGHPEFKESEELTEEEKQKLRDFICVQKWNGKEFDCACSDFDLGPSQLMLR